MKDFSNYLIKEDSDRKYYIISSSKLKDIQFKFDKATGQMSLCMLNNKKIMKMK